jgi:hypothetical protein
MKNYSKAVVLAACCVLILAGCTGPKIITRQPSSSKMLRPIPPNATLFVACSCDDGVANSIVQDKLVRVLRNTGKFAAVESGTATSDDLQLNIEIRAKRSLWSRRAYNGDFSRVSAGGVLVVGQVTLVELNESRSGSGGPFGSGGMTSCGEDGMIKALTRWVIQDVADYLKTVQVDGR